MLNKIEKTILLLISFIIILYIVGYKQILGDKIYLLLNSKDFISKDLDLRQTSINNIEIKIQSEERISGVGQNNDPAITIPLEPAKIKNISLNIKTSKTDFMQIFYITEIDSSFTEQNSYHVALTEGEQRVTIKFNNINRKIKALRIDPIGTNTEFIVSDVKINE